MSDRLPQLHLINRLHEPELCWMGPPEGEFPLGDTTIQFQGMKRVTLLVKNERSPLLRENWVAAQLPKTGADENPRDPLKSISALCTFIRLKEQRVSSSLGNWLSPHLPNDEFRPPLLKSAGSSLAILQANSLQGLTCSGSV